VLPNAWDAASAAVMEDAGAKAVATSSAAVAWAHGYPDGDALPLEKVLLTIETVVRAVKVPVTADIEGGYTDDLGQLAENIKAVVGAGAVGINLEDGTRDPDLHARKIEAARKAADAAGVALFINARTDTYLKRLFEGDAAEAETVKRAALYRGAGASGVFVPGPTDDALIGRLAGAIDGPMNIMLTGGLPSSARLQALGVRRLSSGGRPFAGAYAYLANAVKSYLADGLADPFLIDGLGNLDVPPADIGGVNPVGLTSQDHLREAGRVGERHGDPGRGGILKPAVRVPNRHLDIVVVVAGAVPRVHRLTGDDTGRLGKLIVQQLLGFAVDLPIGDSRKAAAHHQHRDAQRDQQASPQRFHTPVTTRQPMPRTFSICSLPIFCRSPCSKNSTALLSTASDHP